ncbi:MAG TPA: class I SAM-dependent methyltransferase, partial [Reyranella sp.]|nr:class I SAM-dependent methyltransferase [Reyranella sp.]
MVGAAEYSLCSHCLTVQKTATPAWQAMAEHVYANYDINHQSEGAEPTIFDSAKGSGPRSLILLRNFLDTGELAEEGRLLDIGCSNGNLLQTFHSLRPRWKLSGAELVDQWKETVLALPGVEAFYSGPNPAYAGRFDVISLSHVLEHIPDPIPFLKAISGHLTPG